MNRKNRILPLSFLGFLNALICLTHAGAEQPVIGSAAQGVLGNSSSSTECKIVVWGKNTGCPRCDDVKGKFSSNDDKTVCPQIEYKELKGNQELARDLYRGKQPKCKYMPAIIGGDGKVYCDGNNTNDMEQRPKKLLEPV
jgi:hypothetical protein